MTEAFIKAVVGVVVTASWGFCVWLVKRAFTKQKETETRQEAIEDGLRSLLRAEIIRTYEKSMDRGFCPLYSKQALEICYNAYHNGLNGNGAITDIYTRTMNLPTNKPRE